MQYLLEHEFGFDLNVIGFPSISGCHAILFLSTTGLFGFHNAGGSGKDDWQGRAQVFAAYVNEHFLGKGTGLHLYGCSFVGDNRRGYPDVGKSAKRWKEELQAFAAALAFGGSISGYDLAQSGIGATNSAYVEYRLNGVACDILVKQWSDTGKAMGPNEKKNNHRKRVGGSLDRIVTAVDNSGLNQVASQKLR